MSWNINRGLRTTGMPSRQDRTTTAAEAAETADGSVFVVGKIWPSFAPSSAAVAKLSSHLV